MTKRIIIYLLVMMSAWLTADDLYYKQVNLHNKTKIEVKTIPSDKTLVLKKITSSRKQTQLNIYDDTKFIWSFKNSYEYTVLLPIKNKLIIKQNQNRNVTWSFNWYFVFSSGSIDWSIDVKTEKYTGEDWITIVMDFLKNPEVWKIEVLYFIRFIAVYFVWLDIKRGFIAWKMFYKNHFVKK